MSDSRLFKPIPVGKLKLSHRVVMSPLTRFRASDDHVPLPFVRTYYGQRASVPGTLIISEATFISPAHGGYDNAPGIYNSKQIEAWRTVTDEVHAKGSYIFCQLWALGRTADAKVAEKEGITIASSSNIPLGSNGPEPLPLTVDQIQTTIHDYVAAAKNAISAGFDGVELHGANGYLIDQFIQDICNQRTDEYGGSIEKRSRFAVEIVKAVSAAIGSDRTGIRLSPFGKFNAMKMDDPIPQFSDVIRKIEPLHLAYLHLVDSRISGNTDVVSSEKLDFAINLWKWKDSPVFVAGGLDPDSARRLVDEEYPNQPVVAVFGRHFISNPDLPYRIKTGISLHPYNRDTFYTPKVEKGYTDYAFSKEFLASVEA